MEEQKVIDLRLENARLRAELAEDSLRARESLFNQMVEQAPMGVYVVGADFRVRQMNSLALPTFANVEPLIGRDFEETQVLLWGPEVAREVVKIFRHTLETGERYVSPSFSERRHDIEEDGAFEWEIQRMTLPDGSLGVVCYFKDVTERWQAERNLQQSQENLRKKTAELEAVLEAMPAFVWIAQDAECKIITGNRAANELMRIEPGTNVSQTPDGAERDIYLTIMKPDGTPYRVEEMPMERALVARQPVIGEVLDFRFPDGRQIYAMGNAVPLFDEQGEPRGGVAAFHDITALKLAAAELDEARKVAEAASLSKDQFLAMLSHELRMPLNPALMAVNLLLENPDSTEETRKDLEMIKRNLGLQVKLIDDLLDVSRITMGKLLLARETLDLNEAVRDVCSICAPQMEGNTLALKLDLSPDLQAVTADPARLRQVLWNLLRNAIKFTPQQGTIQVSTNKIAPQRCEVRVRDSGMGIEPEMLPIIFGVFQQGNPQITRKYGGLGLGLAICQSLVDLHGGSIRAESGGLGQGATFVVELPTV